MADGERDVSLIFTDLVRAMVPGGPPPDPELVDRTLTTLRGALVKELRKRTLWRSSPRCLGIYGAADWSDSALEELVHDCFVFIFLSRLGSLRARLVDSDNVEGMVFVSLRNYLYNSQKKFDPVGFRVFESLRDAIRQLATEETLHVLSGDDRVRNDTVLGFVPDAAAPGAVPAEAVRSWSDDLMPDLITARGKRRDEVTARLATHVARLGEEGGTQAFRFKDVVDLLKNGTRARWRAYFSQQEGETAFEDADEDFAAVVRLVRPDTSVEERDAFEKLLACMAEALERADVKPRTQEYLERLWGFLRACVSEGEDKPPARRTARILGIPRDRLPGLYGTLGRWVQECRDAAISGDRQLLRPFPEIDSY